MPAVITQPAAESATIKVLIADDHPLIIAGIRRTIEHRDDLEVCGEARTGAELIELVPRRAPDVVLMDLHMPAASAPVGVELIARLRAEHPDVRIVVLSACDERPTIIAALTAGADAYVLKSVHTVDLSTVLCGRADGFIGPLAGPAAPTATAPGGGCELTERERSVLGAVAAGKTTATISRELWLSEHTIKFHLTNIYRKLGVANRAAAIRWALTRGLA